MNENVVYPALLIVTGILLSTLAIMFLMRVSRRIVKLFALYPESKGILSIALKIINWFIGLIIFLIFLRWALMLLNREFTKNFIENIIVASPKYMLAVVILVLGFYASRLVREQVKDQEFEFKERMLLIIDAIMHMTFFFTALSTIGVNTTFFIEFYKVILWTIGTILALIVGIPLGIGIREKLRSRRNSTKIKRRISKARASQVNP